MPSLKLSQAAVDRMRPPADGKAITHWDAALTSFGVRVSPQNRKTYLAQYRVKGLGKDGKDLEVVETFGTADKITLAEAQKQARSSFTLAREGIHPVHQRKQKLQAAQASAAEQAFTFERLAERYLAEYVEVNNRPSTAAEVRRLLRRAARLHAGQGCFGELPASAITRSDIDALMTASLAIKTAKAGATTNGLLEGNNLLAALQRCFGWARRLRLVPENPTLDMQKPMQRVPTRDRVLSDDECIAFWGGCDAIGWPFGPLFKLLLLTGQRRTEVAGMRWAEIDLDKRIWTLPKERVKNNKAHEVALSDLAVEILEGLPPFASDYVFASARGDAPVDGFPYAKANVAQIMGVADWRLHDLRRTCTTGMARLNVPPHVADRVLNHQSGTISGVAAVYNRFQYLDERREALNAWGDFVARLIGRGGDNVIALVGR